MIMIMIESKKVIGARIGESGIEKLVLDEDTQGVNSMQRHNVIAEGFGERCNLGLRRSDVRRDEDCMM